MSWRKCMKFKQPAGVFGLTWAETFSFFSSCLRCSTRCRRSSDWRLSLWTSWTCLNIVESSGQIVTSRRNTASVCSMQDSKVLFRFCWWPESLDEHRNVHRAETELSSDSQRVAFTIKLIQSLDLCWTLFPTDPVNVWIHHHQRNYERKIQNLQNKRTQKFQSKMRQNKFKCKIFLIS